jgi:hypothetical protein
MKKSTIKLALYSLSMLFLYSCDRTTPYEIAVPPAEVHFIGSQYQTYQVKDEPTSQYRIRIGTTNVSNVDRTVQYLVKPISGISPSGYTIPTGQTRGTLTIPAGQTTASITVKAPYAPYDDPFLKDTLLFTLAEPSIKVSGFQDSVYLVLRGRCVESDVNLQELLGTYNQTFEDFGGQSGPYSTRVINVRSLSPTTGIIDVEKIYDPSWTAIRFILDWTDPNNRTVTLNEQVGMGAAETITSNYPGWVVQVAPGSPSGTFSICNQTIEINMRVGLLNPEDPTQGGFFNTPFNLKMAR